jgi:PKD repeat protein
VSYRWDFGDGDTINGSCPSVNHTFALKGWYAVALNVTDGQGYSDGSVRTIYVNATPPTVTLGLDGHR